MFGSPAERNNAAIIAQISEKFGLYCSRNSNNQFIHIIFEQPFISRQPWPLWQISVSFLCLISRVCLFDRKDSDQPPQPTILFKSNRHHRGSIYCVAWSAAGDIIATGSNDKSIKMTKFDAETCSVTWPGLELAIHNGTVRDLAFVSRASGTPVLVSGGAGSFFGSLVIFQTFDNQIFT